ncbi:hypothetical protein AB0L65_10030 [Nonomuraea sp. NPDC052116]|uniref:hypothetical protein n=1 Tax=Nonomuraea sp. NPDC052116 TaxID=3155665 RepID=UPI0034238907
MDKIDTERSLSNADPAVRANPRVWGAHDLPAALYIRDRVEQALAEPDAPQEAREVVAAADARFAAATRAGGRRLISLLLNEDLTGKAWWWDRVPTSGPIIEELGRLFGG